MKPATKISPSLRCYRKRALEFVARGLTTKGTPRKRRPNARCRSVRLEMRRMRGLQAWNLRVTKLRKMGKTSRGTERIYATRRGDAILLKSLVDAFAQSLGKIFNELPGETQAKAIALENHLSAIRCQL